MIPKGVKLAGALAAMLASVALTSATVDAKSVVWLTKPSDLRQMAFLRAGIIKETLVEEGDTVKAGQLLIRQDDSVEQEEFKKLDDAANDKVRIRFAEVALEQAQVDLKKYETAFANGSVTATEVEHSRLEVKKNQASLDIARLENRQAGTDRDQMGARLEQMRIVSPIDGRVERIMVREGVAAQALDPVIILVCTDPLWADVPVSFAQANAIKLGDTVKAVFYSAPDGRVPLTGEDDGSAPPQDAMDAKVIYKATVADVAGKITVRIEFPNPDGVPAGGHVKVWLDEANR